MGSRAIGGTALLMQGGHHPDLGVDYYEDLFSSIKARYPVHLHALSPSEIQHAARRSKITIPQALTPFQQLEGSHDRKYEGTGLGLSLIKAMLDLHEGSLHVDSTPRGARVFIDRKLVGVTPLLMTDVSAGSHVIRLETDGHSAWSSAIRVVAERQTDVSPTLAPSRQIAAP